MAVEKELNSVLTLLSFYLIILFYLLVQIISQQKNLSTYIKYLDILLR